MGIVVVVIASSCTTDAAATDPAGAAAALSRLLPSITIHERALEKDGSRIESKRRRDEDERRCCCYALIMATRGRSRPRLKLIRGAGRCFLEKESKTVGRSSNGRGGKDKVLLFIGLGKGKRKGQVISVGRDEHGRGTKRFVWTVEQEKKGA
jgi:hypothetical protein